jgi:hypothetical protein
VNASPVLERQVTLAFLGRETSVDLVELNVTDLGSLYDANRFTIEIGNNTVAVGPRCVLRFTD